MKTTKLNNGLTAVAGKDGYAKTYANATQANKAAAKLRDQGVDCYVWVSGFGRVRYVVLNEE